MILRNHTICISLNSIHKKLVQLSVLYQRRKEADMENNKSSSQNNSTRNSNTRGTNRSMGSGNSRNAGSSSGNNGYRNGTGSGTGSTPKKDNKNMTANNKHKKKKNKRLRQKVRLTVLAIFLVFSLLFLAGCLFFDYKYGDAFVKYQNDANQLVGDSTPETFRQMETSLVYDSNKKLLSVLKGEKDVYYLSYDNIPQSAVQAMISIEDKKFLEHGGVDLSANIRAFVALVKHRGEITQGASTITQQLARNIFLSNEVSYERKLKEIFLAVDLEKKYSKREIMEFYLNNIYFANGYYGIQAASKGYFSKDVNKLSLSQIAYLCAIPNNPTIYDPLDYPANTLKRRDRILYQMYKDGKISEAEYDQAVAEKIKLKTKKPSRNNYVETYIFYCATRALMEQQGFVFKNQFKSDGDKKEYDKEYKEAYNKCQKSLYYGGYRIYTSIDMKKQEQLQKSVDDTLANFTEKTKDGIYKFQGAAVSIDNKTGRVIAIVGGRYQNTGGLTLNRAYQSFRQPGSSIKPLIVYTPSFENGYYPDNVVNDHKFEGGPSNSDGVYLGKIPLRTAVEKSKNTVAWQLYEELTPKVGLSYLLNMNFNRIDKNDYYPATSLGGFTYGVSPLEMTSGYAALENDGVFRKPTCIVSIKDSEGNVIVDGKMAKKQVYSQNAARMMTDVLTGVIKNGTGRGLGLNNMISAGKTGTTNDKKDGWFVGYTPYYTTGVWVGYDSPKTSNQLAGATYPGNIWKTYMNEINKGLENIPFSSYTDTRSDEEKAKDQGITPTPTETPTPTPTETPTPTPTDTVTEEPTEPGDGGTDITETPTEPENPDNGENPDNPDNGTDPGGNGTNNGSGDGQGTDNGVNGDNGGGDISTP